MYKRISCFGERKITQCNLTVTILRLFFSVIIHHEIVSKLNWNANLRNHFMKIAEHLSMTLSCLFSGISLIVRWKRAETKEIASWCKMFIFFLKVSSLFSWKITYIGSGAKESKLLCWERMVRIFLFLKKLELCSSPFNHSHWLGD